MTYAEIATELNRQNGNDSWDAHYVENWFNGGHDLDEYQTVEDVIEAIRAAGSGVD